MKLGEVSLRNLALFIDFSKIMARETSAELRNEVRESPAVKR